MNPPTPETKPNLGKDMEAFEALPIKTQELAALQEQAEKTTGTKKVALHKKIRHQSGQATGRRAAGNE